MPRLASPIPDLISDKINRLTEAWPLITGIIASLIVYGELALTDPKLNWDDQTYLASLTQIGSLKEYFQKLWKLDLIDLYPVRDLFWLIDQAILARTGISTYHLGNLLLWIGILFWVYRMARKIHPESKASADAVTLLYALHPLAVCSVAWISARKHLLAAFFIFWATSELLTLCERAATTLGNRLRLTLAYLLSVLSIPIASFWPIWAAVYLSTRRDARRSRASGECLKTILPLVIAMASALIVFAFYISIPSDQTGKNAPLAISFGAKCVDWVLTQGRATFNAIIPYFLSLQYSVGSIWNVVGSLLFGFLIWLAFLLRREKDALIWLAFACVPGILLSALSFLHGRPREDSLHYLSDNYLLISTFGLLNFLVLAVRALSLRIGGNPRRVRTVGATLIAALALSWSIESYSLAQNWKSDEALWNHVYLNEHTLLSQAKVATTLVHQGRNREALEELLRIRERDPNYYWLPSLLSATVFSDTDIALEKKIQILESLHSDDAWLKVFLARLYALHGDFSHAFDKMKDSFTSANAYGDSREAIAAEIYLFCRKGKQKSCDEIREQAIRSEPSRKWHEERYQEGLQAHGQI